MKDKARVLLVEDSPSLSAMYQQYLKNEPIHLDCVSTGEAAKEYILEWIPEIILLDLNLPDMNGLDIMKWSQAQKISSQIIVITAHSSIDKAVEAMRHGAKDFLEKPFDASRLRTTLRNTLESLKLSSYVCALKKVVDKSSFHGFIGSNILMQAVYKTIEAAAPSRATVLITGESGTGKEVCADAIHKQSIQSHHPFIPINCGAIPRDLMESEIFGHVKGAFTGALSDRKGAALAAHKGTLFLDEITEMDLDLQTKLLRFLQTGIVKKLGSNKEERVDVRIICATNKKPLMQVENGTFREDLYYRLNVIPINLPALRERGEDIITLARYFLEKLSKEEQKYFEDIDIDVKNIFLDYSWPGNVRQLQNVIRNIVVLHNDKTVKLSHLPSPINKPQLIKNSVDIDSTINIDTGLDFPHKIIPLMELEKKAILDAVEYCDGNIVKAAALLNVSPSTIYRKKQSW